MSLSDTYRAPMELLPDWFPQDKVLGLAEDGGYVVRVSLVSKEARRLRKEGWRVTPSGRRHSLVQRKKVA